MCACLLTEAQRRHTAYWKLQLEGTPAATARLPCDGPRAEPDDLRSLQQSIVIAADLADALRAARAAEAGTLSTAVLAAGQA